MYLPDHGANPYTLYEQLNMKKPDRLIDLSENVNALGQPDGMEKVWQRLFSTIGAYPHMEGEPLRSELAQMHHVLREHVVVTNGAAEGLMAIAQLLKGREAIVLEPSFSEYKRTLRTHGVNVQSLIVDQICDYSIPFYQLEQLLTPNHALYICNPNNPTGVCQTADTMQRLIDLTKRKGALLIVDEAFMDFTEEASSVVGDVMKHPHLIVLRSMTKMYALAGVRLGYIVSQYAQDLAKLLPHWSVSGVAIELGRFCIQQKEFVAKSRMFSNQQRAMMRSFLIEKGATVSNSAVNFISFKPPFETAPFYRYLLERGVVTRHSENFLGLDGEWLRIGMKSEEALQALQEGWLQYENNILYSSRSNRVE